MVDKQGGANERIKRRYLQYLKEAKRLSEASVDKAAAAIERFDAANRRKDFRKFHIEQAVAFKEVLERATNSQTGKPLSKGTLEGILNPLKSFFLWLADQDGYRSRIRYSDADYFNLSLKDQRIARTGDQRPSPSLEQVRYLLATMPAQTVLEKRDRAIVAFLILTGIRDGALVTLRLKHVDIIARCIRQDAREVRTKFAKTMTTYFFPVCPEAEEVFAQWVGTLRTQMLYGPNDPLFPRTKVELGAAGAFEAVGLDRVPWSGAGPVRKIVGTAFSGAGMPAYGPHSFRHLLARLGEENTDTIEAFKAWSENLGHDDMLITLTSYGRVSDSRRRDLLAGRG